MKSILIAIACCLFYHSNSAQSVQPPMIYKDTAGNILEGKALEEYAKNGVNMKKGGIENGRQVAILIPTQKDETRKAREALEQALANYVGHRLPSFRFKDLQGHVITDKTIHGKVAVFNFWFVGCDPCLREMPELNELVKKYKTKHVMFLAPAPTKKGAITAFLKKHPFDYKVIADQGSYLDALGISVYPTHFIVDQEGIIRYAFASYTGNIDGMLSMPIESLLKR